MATERRLISGSPLAFSEKGVRERIKNILNFKKPSRFIVTLAVASVVFLIIGFSMSKAIDRNLSMQGANLSDLQTDDIIDYVVQATGANDGNILVNRSNFPINVSDNFDLTDSSTVTMIFSKKKIVGNRFYLSQLRIFNDEQKFWVTKPEQIESPQSHYLLKHYLDALKNLPQEHIRELTHDSPDEYIINFVDDGVPNDNQPCLFYNMNGLTDRSEWQIRLDIQPMYSKEGGGFRGSGSDVIHAFYSDNSLQSLGTPGGNLDGRPMTLDDVKNLAARGDNLLFEDLMQFQGANVSSSFDRYIMVYSVEGGYRLVVNSNLTGKPDNVNLESIWESGGSGIDIRYSDVDRFVNDNPSHPASSNDAR